MDLGSEKQGTSPPRGRWGRIAGLAAAALLVWVGLTEWRIYIREVADYQRPVVAVARYLDGLPEQVSACGVTGEFGLSWAEVQFLGWPRTLVELDPIRPNLDEPACAAEPVVWIFSPDEQATLGRLRQMRPGGIEEVHRDSQGGETFTSYLIW